MSTATFVTTNAIVMRRSNPVTRSPGSRSSRRVRRRGKRRQSLAERDNAADVSVGATLACVRHDILVQAVEVAFGKRGEDDLQKVSPALARRSARLDALEYRV